MNASRFQFSMRWLFFAMTLAAVITYWLALPSVVAVRYTAALNEGEFVEANRMYVDGQQTFPGSEPEYETFTPHASVEPWTWDNLRAGTRDISVAVEYHTLGGVATFGFSCFATRDGIEVVRAVP